MNNVAFVQLTKIVLILKYYLIISFGFCSLDTKPHYVAQAGLELTEITPSASAPWVLWLKAYTTTLDIILTKILYLFNNDS